MVIRKWYNLGLECFSFQGPNFDSQTPTRLSWAGSGINDTLCVYEEQLNKKTTFQEATKLVFYII